VVIEYATRKDIPKVSKFSNQLPENTSKGAAAVVTVFSIPVCTCIVARINVNTTKKATTGIETEIVFKKNCLRNLPVGELQ
jgi:hypothetical protein